MCEFQSLYFSADGYVVRCKECDCYQVAFGSTMFTLAPADFSAFCKMVPGICSLADQPGAENTRCIVIPTPYQGISMLLTRNEAKRFNRILKEAEKEAEVQYLFNLFRQ